MVSQQSTVSGQQLHSLVSWRSILAGLTVAFLVYSILFFLGVGVGGIGLPFATRRDVAQAVGIGAGVWIVATAAIALLAGSYFGSRTSNMISVRIGAAQGLVIAGLFFSIMFAEMVLFAGAAGMGLTSLVGMSSLRSDSRSGFAKSTVEAALGDLNLKSDFETVAAGVAGRIMRGDLDSARNFLAYQTGSSGQATDERIQMITSRLDQLGRTTSRAISGWGWLAFLTISIGAMTSIWGGSMGSKSNHRHPLDAGEVYPFARSG